MSLPPPPPPSSGPPVATLPPLAQATPKVAPSTSGPTVYVDPFAPSPELLGAAPVAPVRPSFAAAPERPAAPVTAPLDDTATAPAPTRRKRPTGHLPTAPARFLVALLVPCYIALSLALGVSLLRSAEPGTSAEELRNQLAGGVGVASVVIYLCLMWWMVGAAINARRITQLAVSPMTPLIVLLGGPALLVAGGAIATSELLEDSTREFVATGMAALGGLILGLGHLVLLASYRSTADRLGGARQPWSVLIWVPIGAAVGQAALTFIVYPRVESERIAVFIWLLSLAVGGIATVAYVVAMWRAMTSFDHACRRDRSLERADVLPTHFAYGRI